MKSFKEQQDMAIEPYPYQAPDLKKDKNDDWVSGEVDKPMTVDLKMQMNQIPLDNADGIKKLNKQVDLERKKNNPDKEISIDEDAPVNATGDAVQTNQPIVKKKKKDKKYADSREVGTPELLKHYQDGTPGQTQSPFVTEGVANPKILKKLKMVKGMSSKGAEMIAQLPIPVLTQILNSLGTIVSGDEPEDEHPPHVKDKEKAKKQVVLKGSLASVNEARLLTDGKLVTGVDQVLDIIAKKLKAEMGKRYKKNNKDGMSFINSLAKIVGLTASEKGQTKNRMFLKMGDFDSLNPKQKTQLYKLYSKGMDLPAGSPAFKKNKVAIDKLRKALKLDEGDYGRGDQKGSAKIRNKSYFDSSVGTGWMGAMKDYMHGHITNNELGRAFPGLTKKDLQSLLKPKEVKSNSQDWRVSASVYKKKISQMMRCLFRN